MCVFVLSCSKDDNTYLTKNEGNDLHKTELKIKTVKEILPIPSTSTSDLKYKTSIATFFYGSNGYLEKSEKTNNYHADIEYAYFKYDGQNLISQTNYMADFLYYQRDFFYENDLITKTTYIFPKIGIPYTTYYKYNENKDLIRIEYHKNNESIPYQTTDLLYNSTKKIITIVNICNDDYKDTSTLWLDNKNNPYKFTLPESYLKISIEGTQNISQYNDTKYNNQYNEYSYPIQTNNYEGTQYYEYDFASSTIKNQQ